MKFEKIREMKKGKHAITALCMLVGISVLSTAVYANYDDARGYTNYKEAVKRLAFEETNFSINTKMSLSEDGKDLISMEGRFKKDADEHLTDYKTCFFNGACEEDLEVVKNKVGYNIDREQKTYDKYPSENNDPVLVDISDPTAKKAVRFAELLGDAIVGDLKNNFVLESKEDGLRNYRINVSGNQIPEVVNAGLSLMFGTMNGYRSNGGYVEYADENAAFAAYYKEKTGRDLKFDEYGEWANYDDDDKEMNEDADKHWDDFSEKYWDILDKYDYEGVVYVKADGSHVYYAKEDEFLRENNDYRISERDVMARLGEDPYIHSASSYFTLDAEGRLVKDVSELSMVGVDSDGNKHVMTLRLEAEIYDYGKTEIEAPDLTGYSEIAYKAEAIPYTTEQSKEIALDGAENEKADAIEEAKEKSDDKKDATDEKAVKEDEE